MPFKKGKRKTGGRKKGVKNATTIASREAMLAAFAEMGGVESLVNWARRHKTEFYRLWSKTLPREINAEFAGTINLKMPDMSDLSDAELAELDAIYEKAEQRKAIAAGSQSGAGTTQPQPVRPPGVEVGAQPAPAT